MTDLEIENHLIEMEKIFGILPDPEIFPKSFGFLVKLYQHRMKLRAEAMLQESNSSEKVLDAPAASSDNENSTTETSEK